MQVPETGQSKDLTQTVEAADRAGSIVTEQVRTIIEAAETNAAELRRGAERDSVTMRRQAVEAANRLLERMDALERPLGDLVTSLRREVDSLTAELDRRDTH
jgi:hypothetical protein